MATVALHMCSHMRLVCRTAEGWQHVSSTGMLEASTQPCEAGVYRFPVELPRNGMAAVNAALNIVCLRLLKRHRGEDVNFKASAIFTSNDSIVNLAIVLSGALVMWSGSNLPDLVLGLVVAAIAANGGREILAEAAEAGKKGHSEAA